MIQVQVLCGSVNSKLKRINSHHARNHHVRVLSWETRSHTLEPKTCLEMLNIYVDSQKVVDNLMDFHCIGPTPIQSISCNIRLCVCLSVCLSVTYP